MINPPKVKCPKCKHEHILESGCWCPNCGADMTPWEPYVIAWNTTGANNPNLVQSMNDREFPPLSDQELELSANPAVNRPHTVRMALELIEARKRLKLLDRLKINVTSDWECPHGVFVGDGCEECGHGPMDEDGEGE